MSTETCSRPDCEAIAAPDALYCTLHMRAALGLDACKAVGCSVRAPAGAMWCVEHQAERDAGRLSVTGVAVAAPAAADPEDDPEGANLGPDPATTGWPDVDLEDAPPVPPEDDRVVADLYTLCRLDGCEEPALDKTIGSGSPRWRDLCEEHYEEQRAVGRRASASWRGAPTPEDVADLLPPDADDPPHAPFCALDTDHDAMCLDWAGRTAAERARLNVTELSAGAAPWRSAPPPAPLPGDIDDALPRSVFDEDSTLVDPFDAIVSAWIRALAACYDAMAAIYDQRRAFWEDDAVTLLKQAGELLAQGREYLAARDEETKP